MNTGQLVGLGGLLLAAGAGLVLMRRRSQGGDSA